MSWSSWLARLRALVGASRGPAAASRRHSPSPSARLSLETLGERIVPSTVGNPYVAMEIPNQGVWVYSPAHGWQHPTTNNATALAVNGSGLAAMELPGQGVWLYNANSNTWQHPTTANATSLDIDETGNVAMELPGQGVWIYHSSNNTWQHPTTVNATQVSISDGNVAMMVQGQGTYVFNSVNNTWQHPSTSNASQLAVDASGNIATEVTGHGVYLNGSLLTAANATLVDEANAQVSINGVPGGSPQYDGWSCGPNSAARFLQFYGINVT